MIIIKNIKINKKQTKQKKNTKKKKNDSKNNVMGLHIYVVYCTRLDNLFSNPKKPT